MAKNQKLVVYSVILVLLASIILTVNPMPVTAVLFPTAEGIVTDRFTGKPLPNVHVRLSENGNPKGSTYTDSNGYYSIARTGIPIPNSVYVILKFSKSGYRTKSFGVLLYKRQITTVNCELNPYKMAILVDSGSTNYIWDAKYDVMDMYTFLENKGFICAIYGGGSYLYNDDGVNGRYVAGYSTKANVRSAIQDLSSFCVSGDKVVLYFTGHGASDETQGWLYEEKYTFYAENPTNNVRSYLKLWHGSATDYYYDYELRIDLEGFNNNIQITIFTDVCGTGGFLPDISHAQNAEYILFLAACFGNGHGWTSTSYKNGLLTYWVLESFNVKSTWEDAFSYAINSNGYLQDKQGIYNSVTHPIDGTLLDEYRLYYAWTLDHPEKFDGNTHVKYYL
ncbi:MAG: carboxypeptidase regulatory-like domain-containing protein [Candidatus Hodarchaeota archaeon]